MDPGLLPYWIMILGQFSFACMSGLARGLGKSCPWQMIALGRVLVPLCVTFGALAFYRKRPVLFGEPALWIRSGAGSTSLVLTFYALPRLPLSSVLALTNLFPLWIALLEWPCFGYRPSRDVWGALVCGLFGVYLILEPEFGVDSGSIAALVSSLFSAIAMLGLNRLKHIDPRAIVAHFSLVALVFCLITLAVTVDLRTWSPPPPLLVAGLVGVGAASTLGQFCLTYAFTHGQPARVGVVGLVQLAFALIFDIAIWGDQISWRKLAGILLIVVPVGFLMSRQRRPSPNSSDDAASRAQQIGEQGA